MNTLVMDSPLGPLVIDTSPTGTVVGINFADGDATPSSQVALAASPAATQLREFFDGARCRFEIDYAFQGTQFQQAVWRQIARIPYGETVTYGDIARAIGKPNASRAVGAACGSNPVSIVVPCHRVVGTGNRLTGYGGGLHRKSWLLDFECRQAGSEGAFAAIGSHR